MRRTVACAVFAGVLLGSLAGVPASAETKYASPPTSADLSTATNALMRPADLTGVLAAGITSKDAYRVGYNNPPGGQDPLPICSSGPGYNPLPIPGDSAVGYAATYGTVTHDVYRYASADVAQRVWSRLNTKIPATCRGTFVDDDGRSTLSSTRLPGVGGGPQGWGVSDVTPYSAQYSAVILVGDAIQMVSYTERRSSLPRGTVSAIDQLGTSLAGRWVNRATAPMTQDATLTKAQTVMLTPADVPPALPVEPPAKGGWSDFTSYTPEVYLFGCFGVLEKLQAKASYTVGMGGSGDIFPAVGSLGQQIYAFGSADAARKAWTRLTKAMAACSENADVAIPATGDFRRQVHGVSPLSFDGVPGLWSRQLDRADESQGQCSNASGPTPCDSFTVKSYTLYLLVGDTIQSVGYSTGVLALREVKLDQLSVNVLAEELANRWVTHPLSAR